MQVILSYEARSYCLHFDQESFTWNNLTNEISATTSIPLHSQRIIIGGKYEICTEEELKQHSVDDTLNFIQLKLRNGLLGGKGGFGALLRTSKNDKKTTNFGACKDLNGRRLKDIQIEQKLAEKERNKDMPANEGAEDGEEGPEQFGKKKGKGKKGKYEESDNDKETKKAALEREIYEQRKQILENVADSIDQGFAAFSQEKKKEKKEKKKRKKAGEDEVELPEELWGDFGIDESDARELKKVKHVADGEEETKEGEKNESAAKDSKPEKK